MKRALVLGGGGAKGAAHVGVIRALEEIGFRPDLIVGLSIGAIVGAGYALLDDASRLWEISRKVYAEGAKRFPFKLGVSGEKMNPALIALACSYMNTFKAALPSWIYFRVFKKYVGDFKFSDTKIPFACLSLDLNSAEEIIHTHGSLFEALKSSMSIPGVFPPTKSNGRLLVDGGTTTNLPVSVARALGAERVVAVDLASPEKKRDWETSNSMLAILNAYKEREIKNHELSQADFVLRPVKKSIDTLDFSSCLDSMEEAYENTLESDLSGVLKT